MISVIKIIDKRKVKTSKNGKEYHPSYYRAEVVLPNGNKADCLISPVINEKTTFGFFDSVFVDSIKVLEDKESK